MRINELAKRTGLNAETIRKYRDRGLLRPKCQPENGYYEYSDVDFLNLLYIRKLRGAHLSLDAVEATYTGNADTLLEGYRATIDALEEQIRLLRRRERMLKLSYRHYERDAGLEGIQRIEAFGDKYDSYFSDTQSDPVHELWVKNVDLFTLVLCVPQRYFETEALPERVPVRLGIGTYGTILEENKLPLPQNCACFPKGEYVSFFLELEELDSIPGEALCPVRDFLRRERLRPGSDTTAYLYRVDTSGAATKFIFCTRLNVVPDTE